jgi:hypothetical protein
MLASGSDDHVVSLWNLDSASATISVVWTSRGKIDVHDGVLSMCFIFLLTFGDSVNQGWFHAWYGVVLLVPTFCFLAARTAQSRRVCTPSMHLQRHF